MIDPDDRPPLEIEQLIPEHKRRTVTPEVQQAFRQAISPPTREFDDIDELVGDPVVEKYARPRKESAASRVLRILDELEGSGHE